MLGTFYDKQTYTKVPSDNDIEVSSAQVNQSSSQMNPTCIPVTLEKLFIQSVRQSVCLKSKEQMHRSINFKINGW